MEALLYAFSGNEIEVTYEPDNMFACPPTKHFWSTPEIPESAAFTCSSSKPTASSLLGSFEKQQGDRRTSRAIGSHGVFFYTLVFLSDFGMNNQTSMLKNLEVYYRWW